MSQIINLCNALATALKAATWSIPLTPVVALAPIVELTDPELHVRVLPASDSFEKIGLGPAGTNNAVQATLEAHIVIQRKFGPGESVEAEGLVLTELCGLVAEWLLDQFLDLGGYHASCQSARRMEVVSIADLIVEREFFGLIESTWLTMTA